MITNPYYAKILKKQYKHQKLEIVENFFIPTDNDLNKISRYISDCKSIVDVGSGYGLLINELAKKNSKKLFLGIDTMYIDKEFQKPKPQNNVFFEYNGIEAMIDRRFKRYIEKFDCVICCWMPESSDWREFLAILSEKKIILILCKYLLCTGTVDVYCGLYKYGFNEIDSWLSNDSIIQIWERF